MYVCMRLNRYMYVCMYMCVCFVFSGSRCMNQSLHCLPKRTTATSPSRFAYFSRADRGVESDEYKTNIGSSVRVRINSLPLFTKLALGEQALNAWRTSCPRTQRLANKLPTHFSCLYSITSSTKLLPSITSSTKLLHSNSNPTRVF